ncbi:hypothetical protein Acr_24g0015430 [Actinidia rufa]|uniref:KIB1-4 beta-propeller domain-containing protein n=1 Tax=Actinidia rufa TaxID=165716 RepID=A0A7J0GX31_9ERIC|nr:hypothetical protein Acr_24g0015430 [Actinidia rufa]
MASSYRDWAWLPKNLLWSIVETYLIQFSDFMRFSSVCQQWRCVALENNHRHKQTLNIFKACHNKLPMLLMGTKENHEEKRLLFSVTEGITYEVQLPSPCHNSGMCKLAFYTSGDDSWNFVNTERDYVFSDVIYHKGQVYAVNCWSELVKIDVSSGVHKVMTKISSVCAQVTYLVESQEGDLLLVQRFWKSENNSHSKTFEFKVFKLVYPIGEAQTKWVEIKNIGDQALFFGDNHSLAVSTSKFPGCQSNCIYYTDQHHVIVPPYVCHGPDDDSGVFYIENGKFQSQYLLDFSVKHMLPPIWFVPNLKGN